VTRGLRETTAATDTTSHTQSRNSFGREKSSSLRLRDRARDDNPFTGNNGAIKRNLEMFHLDSRSFENGYDAVRGTWDGPNGLVVRTDPMAPWTISEPEHVSGLSAQERLADSGKTVRPQLDLTEVAQRDYPSWTADTYPYDADSQNPIGHMSFPSSGLNTAPNYDQSAVTRGPLAATKMRRDNFSPLLPGTGTQSICTSGGFENIEGMANLGRYWELPTITEPHMTTLDVFSEFPSKLYHPEAPPLITLDDLQDTEQANTDKISKSADNTNLQDGHGRGYSFVAESHSDGVYYPQQDPKLFLVQPNLQSYPAEDPSEQEISEDNFQYRRAFGG